MQRLVFGSLAKEQNSWRDAAMFIVIVRSLELGSQTKQYYTFCGRHDARGGVSDTPQQYPINGPPCSSNTAHVELS
jgi:hypothetical protein